MLQVVSDVDVAPTFEWIAEAAAHRGDLALFSAFLTSKPAATATALRARGHAVHEVPCAGKRDWPRALAGLWRVLGETRPDIVHTHLLQANILGFAASVLRRVPRLVYTRHHSTLHHDYHPKGVLWDRGCNALADAIVAPSPAVAGVLEQLERVPREKVVTIPHGFPLDIFADVPAERAAAFRARHGLPVDAVLVGSIARMVPWKGIEYVLEAFGRVRARHPRSHLVLLNAVGPHREALEPALAALPPGSFTLIPFEPDVASAYAAMTCLVHAPIDPRVEAFGQVYVEALAAGVPSVFTLSGIAPLVVQDGQNALAVPFRDARAIEAALDRVLGDPDLRHRLRANGPPSVRAHFGLTRMTDALFDLYGRLAGSAPGVRTVRTPA